MSQGGELEAVRRHFLLEEGRRLLSTLDLERLQDLVLERLGRVADAQGAALWSADDQGQLALRAWSGVVDRQALSPRLDPRSARLAAALEAGRPFAPPGGEAGRAFHVPLVAEGELQGLALLTDRAGGRFGEAEQEAALALGELAALALRNARRFQALERIGLRDRESGAYNLAYFVDHAGKEFYKARRYGRSFSLAVVAVDDVAGLRRAAGREGYRRAMRELVAAISRVARDADILAKVSEGEYYVLLPETDAFGALVFQRRAAEEIRLSPAVRQLEERAPLLLAMGSGAYPKDGEDFLQLLHHAKARVEGQRGSLVRALRLDGREPAGFWELCDRLLDPATPLPAGSPSARPPADPERLAALQREAGREIARDPRARGLLYASAPGGLWRAPVLETLPRGEGLGRSGDASARVLLLGPRAGGAPLGHPLVTEVYLDGDKRLASHPFLLYLTERSAYALLTGPDGQAFHTSDLHLVDLLVARLQAAYDLQLA